MVKKRRQDTYDKVGNRVAVLESDGSRVTWTYDDMYQLTGEHRTGANAYRHTFAYDPAGNRTLKNEDGQRTSYTYDAANQLETSEDASGLTTYTYDANGNQQIVEKPSGDRTTTVWDYENRTSVVQLPSGVRNTMAYDPDGLRVQLEESTETKRFIWDEQRYLIEADAAGDTQTWYTVEPTTYGRIISKQQQGGQRRFFHFDGLGSTRVITQANENVNNRYTYDAWGNLVDSFGTNPNPFRFVGEQGYYTDVETDVIYVRARIYQPIIARWWSVDPLMFVDGINLSRYVRNRPTLLADPSGLAAGCSRLTAGAGPWQFVAAGVTQTIGSTINPGVGVKASAGKIVCVAKRTMTARYRCAPACCTPGIVTITTTTVARDAYEHPVDEGENIGAAEVSVSPGIPGLPPWVPGIGSIPMIATILPASQGNANRACSKVFDKKANIKRRLASAAADSQIFPNFFDCDGSGTPPTQIPNPPCAGCPKIPNVNVAIHTFGSYN